MSNGALYNNVDGKYTYSGDIGQSAQAISIADEKLSVSVDFDVCNFSTSILKLNLIFHQSIFIYFNSLRHFQISVETSEKYQFTQLKFINEFILRA